MGRSQIKGIATISNQVDIMCGNCKRTFIKSSPTQIRLHYKLCKPNAKISVNHTISANPYKSGPVCRLTKGAQQYNQ